MWPHTHTHTHTHTQVRCLCVSQVSCENFNKHGDKLKVSHRKWRLFSHSWISLHTVFDPTRTEHTLSSSTYSCSEPGAPDSRGRAHPVSTEKTLTENTNSTLLSEVSRTEASVRLSADDSSGIPALLHVFGRWSDGVFLCCSRQELCTSRRPPSRCSVSVYSAQRALIGRFYHNTALCSNAIGLGWYGAFTRCSYI